MLVPSEIRTIWPMPNMDELATDTLVPDGMTRVDVVSVKALIPLVPSAPAAPVAPGRPGTFTAGTEGQGVQQSLGILI